MTPDACPTMPPPGAKVIRTSMRSMSVTALGLPRASGATETSVIQEVDAWLDLARAGPSLPARTLRQVTLMTASAVMR